MMHLRRFMVDIESNPPATQLDIHRAIGIMMPTHTVRVDIVDDDEPRGPQWDSEMHILYAGWIMGMAIRHGLDVAPVHDDQGAVTPRLQIHLPGRHDMETIRVELVIPPPPPDWKMYA